MKSSKDIWLNTSKKPSQYFFSLPICILFVVLVSLFLTTNIKAQLYFPPNDNSNWETVSMTSLGWCEENVDSLINFLDEKDSKAFIVLKDGKIVIEHYFDTFHRDSLWYWASAAKSLTAFVIGQVQEYGYLNINDQSSDYLGTGWTSCPPDKEALIQVVHQLSMTSGLDDQVADLDCTDDTCLQYMADAGTRWSYHNAPYSLLHNVAEQATGMTVNNWLNLYLKPQTGMTGFFWPVDYNNLFLSNARSAARFGLLILNDGVWDTDTLLHDNAYFQQMVNTSQDINKSYGYLWWLNGKESHMLPYVQYVFDGWMVPAAPPSMFAALGKNDQKIYVDPSQNLVVVRFGNDPEMSPLAGESFNQKLWELLMQVICTATVNEEVSITKHIYYNPQNKQICNIPVGSAFEVVDLYGRIVDKGICNDDHVYVELKTGVYVFKIFSPSGSRSLKIIHSY